MAYEKIVDLKGKGVTGLPDTPDLSTTEIQKKFDELSKDIIIPSFNNLIDRLLQGGEPVKSEDVKAVRKGVNGDIEYTVDGVNWVELSPSKADKSQVYTKRETLERINEKVTEIGSADMTKSIYDTDSNGIVDDSEKLGGYGPENYATKSEADEIRGIADNASYVANDASTVAYDAMPVAGGVFTGNISCDTAPASNWTFKNISVNENDWGEIPGMRIQRIVMLLE